MNLLDMYFAAADAEAATDTVRVTWETWRARRTWTQVDQATAEGGTLFRSSSLIEGGPRFPLNFREVEAFADYPYRRVHVNRELRIILTYCEGDLDYVLYPDDAGYREGFLAAARFYGTSTTDPL